MRIGQLAEASTTTTKTLRFYEDAGLLPAPARTSGGYRDYGPEAIGRVAMIRRCRSAGLSVAQIGAVLQAADACAAGRPGGPSAAERLAALLTYLDARLADLHTIRDTIQDLRATAPAPSPAHTSGTDPREGCPALSAPDSPRR